MPFVIKTQPFNARPSDTVTITEKPSKKYSGNTIRVNAEVFIFTDESANGNGLCWRGVVQDVQRNSNEIDVWVRLDQPSLEYFGNSNLEQVPRGTDDGTPMAGLARKLYYHSHNKIAKLAENETEFLRRYFD